MNKNTALKKMSPSAVSKMESACGLVGELLRSLSHPQRLMIMGHLSLGPKTVSELQDLCGISQSQISQFLIRMRSEGLVKSDRQGRFQYYSAADDRVIELIRVIQKLFCH